MPKITRTTDEFWYEIDLSNGRMIGLDAAMLIHLLGHIKPSSADGNPSEGDVLSVLKKICEIKGQVTDDELLVAANKVLKRASDMGKD